MNPKRWIILLALLLTSCITVVDPGPYWERAGIDENIIGKWSIIGDDSDFDLINIYNKGQTLGIDEYKNKKKVPIGIQNSTYKTLEIGPYHFLLIKYEDGSLILVRYQIQENTLALYNDKSGYIEYFIKKEFPQEKNIVAKSYSLNNIISEKYLQIYHLTDSVMNVLAKIPNDEVNWEVKTTFARVK